MKNIVFIGVLLYGIFIQGNLILQGQDYKNFEISLLTADPGKELFTSWGHSAIRVRDAVSGYDAVFNYGMFDFHAPNFYSNFAQGRLNYYLGAYDFDSFLASYAYENRKIKEQVFELDSVQKQFVINFLINNVQPENRYYLYHFFLDNCATRIRDLMILTYDGLVFPEEKANFTYRELIYLYLGNHPWGRFGIDIALGLPTDQKTNMYEQMFLPDYLFDAFAEAKYNGKPIVKTTQDIFIPDRPAVQPPGFFTPMLVCCLILGLSVLFCFIKKGARLFDFSLFFVVGLIGLLVVFLWFFTDHTNTINNLNIIWALPTHLIMAFFLLTKKPGIFVQKYFLATAMIAVLLLAGWVFLPQKLNSAMIPLTMAIALRAYWNSRKK
ncbi:MAG: DUF4105 domain-containing protein [Bacteroidales bacterium]|jgi:hypothetical protein|nr:DUF4105 domain-containing protein [Bacteroidales bacterium]